MLDNLHIATPLAGNENFHAIIQVIREELERIDPAKHLVYLFDTVDASLLDLLAEQFDMLGFNGWILADTDAQKRELLKSSFYLHSIKGTPGGIEEVVTRLGFEGIIINENTGAPEGAENPWSYFTVTYVLPKDRAILANTSNQLVGLINKYKGAGDILADFNFALRPRENVGVVDRVILNVINV